MPRTFSECEREGGSLAQKCSKPLVSQLEMRLHPVILDSQSRWDKGNQGSGGKREYWREVIKVVPTRVRQIKLSSTNPHSSPMRGGVSFPFPPAGLGLSHHRTCSAQQNVVVLSMPRHQGASYKTPAILASWSHGENSTG